MTVGFIGVGHIVTAIVTGICSHSLTPEKILLSPRNSKNANALSQHFRNVSTAGDNQQVIDGCDLLVLGLRPQAAPKELASLRFRADQPVISLMAMMPAHLLRQLMAPAQTIVRAVPLPSVARGRGPIAMWPSHPAAEAFCGQIGQVIVTDSELALHALWATTALAAPYYQFLDRIARWLMAQNVSKESAASYVGALFVALNGALDPPPNDFSTLALSVSTRGGLNEQAARELQIKDWYAAIDPILETAFERLATTPAAGEVSDQDFHHRMTTH
jgi:pyrroline-5-carboxylate reductase